MDGSPLPGVIVTFKPQEGRPAAAETKADGTYVLEYQYKVNGAKIGPNAVSITYPMSGEGPAGPAIPDKYGLKSELTAEVANGNNTFDWDLKSK